MNKDTSYKVKANNTGIRHAVIGRISRYSEVIPWLFKDIFSHFFIRLIAISLGSFIGSAGYVGAFGIGYIYIKAVQSGKMPENLTLGVLPEAPEQLLVFVIPAIGGVLIFAAILELWSRRQVNWIAWKYGDLCSTRVISSVS